MDNTKKCRETIKNAGPFHCELCDFTSSKESNYIKHLSTRKHKRITMDKKKCQKMPKNAEKISYVCPCGKSYKYQSGLCKHKRSCTFINENVEQLYVKDTSNNISYIQTNNNINDNINDNLNSNDISCNSYKDVFMELINQNKELVKNVMGENKELHNIIKKQQDTFNQQMSEILPKVGNTIHQNNSINNTNKYNLNIFLNDKCKDALDIKEFLESLIIEVADLEYTGREGFVKGISNIFIRGLKELEVTKRPIHCTDLKRDTLYIKDKGKWGKDSNEEKVGHAIDTIRQNTFSKIQTWTKSHPNFTNQEHPQSDQYIKLVQESIGGYDEQLSRNVKKVIKKLANEVYIPSDDLSNVIVE